MKMSNAPNDISSDRRETRACENTPIIASKLTNGYICTLVAFEQQMEIEVQDIKLWISIMTQFIIIAERITSAHSASLNVRSQAQVSIIYSHFCTQHSVAHSVCCVAPRPQPAYAIPYIRLRVNTHDDGSADGVKRGSRTWLMIAARISTLTRQL